MATRLKVLDELARLDLVFKPKVPKMLGPEKNRKYVEYVEVYVNCLMPFSDYELERGITDALEHHKYLNWPTPANLREYCLRHHKREQTHRRPGLDELREQKRLEAPPETMTQEQRDLRCEQLRRIMEVGKLGHADGTRYGVDYEKDCAWVYEGRAAS